MCPCPRRPIRPRAPRVLGVLAVSAAVAGCSAGPRSSGPVAPRRPACVIAADSAPPPPAASPGASPPAPTITAAFEDASDARRAWLATSRLAPLRLDCEGRPSPGLATAWSRDTSGRYWTLELDPTATGDSARWTASALVAAWRADPLASAALRWAGVTSLVPLDDRRLVAELAAASPEVPRALADRALGVPRTPAVALTLAAPPSGDLRDAVDQDIDLVHAADPALLEYARLSPAHTAVALPWSRTYVLLVPAASAGVGAAIPADTAGFLAALAREAVRPEAEAAAGPFWWDARDGCRQWPGPKAPRSAIDAIAYPAGDPVARDLAERLVALAGADRRDGTPLIARGLAVDSFAVALRLGTERGYVLGLPRHNPVPCRESGRWPPGASVLALVDTRPHAVLRRGAPALAVEWDGAVRPAEPGDTLPEAP